MNNFNYLISYFNALYENIHKLISSPQNLTSLISTSIIICVCIAITHSIKKRIIYKVFNIPINQITTPLTCFISIIIYNVICIIANLNYNPKLMRFVLLVALTTIIMRVIHFVCLSIFSHKPYVNFLSKFIYYTLWTFAIISITDSHNNIINFLDNINIFSSKKYAVSIWDITRDIIIILMVIIISTIISRFTEKKISKFQHLDSSLQQILIRTSKICIFIASILITLPIIGIDVTALSVFGGAIGVGIGFGLQKISSNFLSGFIILVDRSIKVGDRLVIDNNAGLVSQITMRYVVMERFDGTEVLIPNETFITNSIQNQSYSNTNLRSEISCLVRNTIDLNNALEIIKATISKAPNILSDKSTTHINRLVDDGVEIKGFFWVESPAFINPATNYIYIELSKLFSNGELSSPQPNQRIELTKN